MWTSEFRGEFQRLCPLDARPLHAGAPGAATGDDASGTARVRRREQRELTERQASGGARGWAGLRGLARDWRASSAEFTDGCAAANIGRLSPREGAAAACRPRQITHSSWSCRDAQPSWDCDSTWAPGALSRVSCTASASGSAACAMTCNRKTHNAVMRMDQRDACIMTFAGAWAVNDRGSRLERVHSPSQGGPSCHFRRSGLIRKGHDSTIFCQGFKRDNANCTARSVVLHNWMSELVP